MEEKNDAYTVKDGEWLDVGKFRLHECCDCGLVHRVSYRIHDGRLQESWKRRDAKAKRKARK